MKIYAEVLEQSALEQFKSAMALDFVVDGALMADAHTGYALPIGAVIATNNVVVPSWVGYDIGCGMCALKLDCIKSKDVRINAQKIFDLIYEQVPVGFNINGTVANYSLDGLTEQGKEIAIKKKYGSALGSLGGGNHFIEIGEDDNDKSVWIVIHCGSRGVGHGMATHYMKKANPDGKAKDGHWGFKADSPEGKDYTQDLKWTLDYALANRIEIMHRVINCICQGIDTLDLECVLKALTPINRTHNHAELKNGVWIHRKGATHAEKGMFGVIPGNMRDGSFIVVGKGNPDSLYSSSHGAGRVMGRKQAKRELSVDTFTSQLARVMAKVGAETLDESPDAYKNIFDVMELQKDLIEVVTHITPIINIKG